MLVPAWTVAGPTLVTVKSACDQAGATGSSNDTTHRMAKTTPALLAARRNCSGKVADLRRAASVRAASRAKAAAHLPRADRRTVLGFTATPQRPKLAQPKSGGAFHQVNGKPWRSQPRSAMAGTMCPIYNTRMLS